MYFYLKRAEKFASQVSQVFSSLLQNCSNRSKCENLSSISKSPLTSSNLIYFAVNVNPFAMICITDLLRKVKLNKIWFNKFEIFHAPIFLHLIAKSFFLYSQRNTNFFFQNLYFSFQIPNILSNFFHSYK